MTPELTSFATRLREFISRTSGAGVSPVSSSTNVTDGEFNRLALELFSLQFTNNTPYRRLCEARGFMPLTRRDATLSPNGGEGRVRGRSGELRFMVRGCPDSAEVLSGAVSVEHWTQIPAVPTSAFKEFELTCLAPGERTAVFHSSGTTEQRPSRHFHCAESLALYEASLWPWFQRHVLAGLEVGRWQLAILTPPPVAAPKSSLVHMFQTVRRKSGAGEAAYLGDVGADGAWTLDGTRAETAIRAAIDASEPLVLLGTAFNFVHLLDALDARNRRFELPPGSVVMETGGYKGRSREMPKPELHARISRKLGVPLSQIICEYGMSELSSQAYDRNTGAETRNPKPETRNFSFPPWARVQIISPETGREVADGETGLVRVFDLANAFSVLAVQTEDLAIRRGNGFELLGRAVAAEPRGCSLMATLVVPPLGGPRAEPPKGGTTNSAARKS